MSQRLRVKFCRFTRFQIPILIQYLPMSSAVLRFGVIGPFFFSQRFLQAVLSPGSSAYRGAATVFAHTQIYFFEESVRSMK